MKELKGDLLTLKKGYICHQVNVDGKMGAGLALQIKNKWPEVFQKYKARCEIFKKHPEELLGQTQTIMVGSMLGIINVFGQFLYRDMRPTRYDAVVDAFEKISPFQFLDKGRNLYTPKYMGCALGGGIWDIYLSIVKFYLPEVNVVEFERGEEIYDPLHHIEWGGPIPKPNK